MMPVKVMRNNQEVNQIIMTKNRIKLTILTPGIFIALFLLFLPLSVNAECTTPLGSTCEEIDCGGGVTEGETCGGGEGECRKDHPSDEEYQCFEREEAGAVDANMGELCESSEEGRSCAGGEGTCTSVPGGVEITCQRNEDTADTGTSASTAEPLAARELPNPLGDITSIPQVIGRVVNMFTGIAGSIALLMFVYGGVLWLTSSGNEERITAGKKAIVWATIGLFVIFGSYAILRVIFIALGARL